MSGGVRILAEATRLQLPLYLTAMFVAQTWHVKDERCVEHNRVWFSNNLLNAEKKFWEKS